MTKQKELLPEEELEQYKKEKEKIRALIGQIGGKTYTRRDKITNILLIILLALLLGFDALRDIFHLTIPLPPVFSVEVGILLVSIKIILMISRQARVEHFQFWILNSIEFRLNNLAREVGQIKQNIGECEETDNED